MRAFPISVALASFLFLAPASADVIAVCGTPGTPAAASYGIATILGLIEPQAPSAGTARPQLALWHDAKGYDVLLNWSEQNQFSLRAQGAEIMGNEMGPDLVHLVVARAGVNGLEHFLFSWDDHAVGELIWSVPADAGGNGSDVASYQMACIKPKP